MGEKHEQYKSLEKNMSKINTSRGGGPDGLKGFYAELANSVEDNIERIDAGIAARQHVIDDNGAADAVIKYANGTKGRQIQDKCGYQYSDYKRFISSGEYDGMILRINPDNPIFESKIKMSELDELASQHHIKIEKAKISEAEIKNVAKVAHTEGEIRKKVGLDSTAPVTSAVYSKSKEVNHVIKNVKRQVNEVGGEAVDGAKGALIGATPAIIHQGAKDVIRVSKGEMEASEAVEDIVLTTGKVAVTGAASRVAKKAVEKTADKIGSKVLKKTIDANAIGKVAGIAISLKDCTNKYINGEIDSGEYLIELFEDGMGFVISETAYIVGDVLGGPLAGACCAYVLSEVYEQVLFASRNERYSKTKLKEMKKIAAKIKKSQEEYRLRFDEAFKEYYNDMQDKLDKAYENLVNSLFINDVNKFLESVNEVGAAYGISCSLGSFEEIDSKMSNKNYVWNF